MITHVAIIYQGKTYSLPRPNRHHHVFHLIYDELGHSGGENEQGFLDENGKFYDRFQALAHALYHKQVMDESKIRANRLFSEDLW